MRIWVIGAAGMLGSALLQACDKKGIDAVGSSHAEADICSVDQLEKKAAKIRPTHIVNCAAYTDVDGAEKNLKSAFAVNSEGAAHVASVAKRCRSRLIHISTDYVFDGLAAQPYSEGDACAPVNVYGSSKWEGEKKVLQTLPSACIVRTSWIFGVRGKNFISSLLRAFQSNEEMKVVSDQCGKPTYCKDAAEAILTLLDAEGIVHFANESGGSRYQIALDFLEILKKAGVASKCRKILPISSAAFPTPAPRPSYSVLSTDKYSSITSIRPRSWNEAASEFLHEALSV